MQGFKYQEFCRYSKDEKKSRKNTLLCPSFFNFQEKTVTRLSFFFFFLLLTWIKVGFGYCDNVFFSLVWSDISTKEKMSLFILFSLIYIQITKKQSLCRDNDGS